MSAETLAKANDSSVAPSAKPNAPKETQETLLAFNEQTHYVPVKTIITVSNTGVSPRMVTEPACRYS